MTDGGKTGIEEVVISNQQPKNMENAPFGITKEEVLELTATKLADAYADDSGISESADRMISERVKEAFEHGLRRRIDDFLTDEMTKLIGAEIVPVNLWGEREGTPTTIRAELSKRARDFWNIKVDDNGKETTWGGEERSKKLMKEILKDEFAKAVCENADVIVAEFKTALKAEATKVTSEHIDKLINLGRSR